MKQTSKKQTAPLELLEPSDKKNGAVRFSCRTALIFIFSLRDYLIPSFLRIALGMAFLCTTMFMVL